MQYVNRHTDARFQDYFNRSCMMWDKMNLVFGSLALILARLFHQFPPVLAALWTAVLGLSLVNWCYMQWQPEVYIRHRDGFIMVLQITGLIMGAMYTPMLFRTIAGSAGVVDWSAATLVEKLQYLRTILIMFNTTFVSALVGCLFPMRLKASTYRCVLSSVLLGAATNTMCRLALDMGVIKPQSVQFDWLLQHDQCVHPGAVCRVTTTFALVVLAGACTIVRNLRYETACRRAFERQHQLQGVPKEFNLWPNSNVELLLFEACMKFFLLWLFCDDFLSWVGDMVGTFGVGHGIPSSRT